VSSGVGGTWSFARRAFAICLCWCHCDIFKM